MKYRDNIYNALIVDDEALARQDLMAVLSEFEMVRVVAEADSVESACEQIRHFNPQLIFLDIQLPGESGFDLLEHIPSDVKIIFVTAFDQYAIRAFEVNARDYLLKPVSRDRLANTLERIDMEPGENADTARMLKPDDSIFLKKDKGYAFVKISNILCIEAKDDYSLIALDNQDQLLVHKSMKEWETRLPEESFCRIHRSTIVNIEKIKNIDPWYNHSYIVSLKGIEKPVVMSRRYFTRIKEKMG
jgi:two-component system, LytTR family, response regulator